MQTAWPHLDLALKKVPVGMVSAISLLLHTIGLSPCRASISNIDGFSQLGQVVAKISLMGGCG